MERAQEETTREGFDFMHTRNQFVSTQRNIFQKTSNQSTNWRKLSLDDGGPAILGTGVS